MKIIVTPEHVAEFYRLNVALYKFLKGGLRNSAGDLEVSFEKTFGNLAQHMLHYMETCREPLPDELQAVPTEISEQKYRPLTLAEVAYDRYAAFIGEKTPQAVRGYGLVSVGTVDRAIQDQAAAVNGIAVPARKALEVEDSIFSHAWQFARQNRARAWQRIGVLLFLTSQTINDMSAQMRKDLEDEGNKVLTHLYHQVEVFEASEMKFAILLGGEALAITREYLLTSSFAIDDGISLGRYLFQDEHYVATSAIAADAANQLRTALNQVSNKS